MLDSVTLPLYLSVSVSVSVSALPSSVSPPFYLPLANSPIHGAFNGTPALTSPNKKDKKHDTYTRIRYIQYIRDTPKPLKKIVRSKKRQKPQNGIMKILGHNLTTKIVVPCVSITVTKGTKKQHDQHLGKLPGVLHRYNMKYKLHLFICIYISCIGRALEAKKTKIPLKTAARSDGIA